MIDQRIFEDLQTKIDEETTVRDVRSPSTRAVHITKFFACQAQPKLAARTISGYQS
jgi:hypothetical protein